LETHKSDKLRLWPAAIILLAGGMALAVIWSLPGSHQQRNIRTLIASFIVLSLLFAWFILASKVSKAFRLLGILAVFLSVFVSRQLFEIRGVTGDLLPIIQLRSRARPALRLSQGHSVTAQVLTNSTEFPQFQGPTRNAIITNINLARDWQTYPPTVLWKEPVGAAWSGFAISRGRAITQEQRENAECVVCYNLLTGDTVWVHSDSARYSTTIAGEGPRTTPSISGDRVVTLGATGLLNCLDFESGKVIWQKDILKENNAEVPDWAVAGSPLIHNGVVFVNPGGTVQRSLVAYSLTDAALIWGAGSEGAGYSSPVLLNFLGQDQILTFKTSLLSHDPQTGKTLWQYPWQGHEPRVSQPVAISSNLVLASSGYGVGAELIKLDLDAQNRWSASRVWKSLALKSKFGPIFVWQDHIYGLDDGIFTCLDLKTGQRKWKDGRYGHGQGLLINNLILLTSEKGELVLIEPNPEKLLELSRLRVFEDKTWNPPALAGEYLVIRNHKEAACLKLSLARASEKNLALLFAKHILAL